MYKYKAVFAVTAQVLVEIEVSAENQQEGLVLAHDAIHNATAKQAQVQLLNLDTAQNISFDRVSDAPAEEAAPAGPLELGTKFTVRLYSQDKCAGEPVLKTDVSSFEASKTIAESVLDETSSYGSASVHDQAGSKVLEVQAPRGGWEVEAYPTNQSEKTTRHSWLESFEVAKRAALQLLERKGISHVGINDFTDRKKGPVLRREIR